MALLHMAIATNLFGNLGDLGGKRQVFRRQRGQHLVDHCLVLTNTRALVPSLPCAPEGIESGAAQELEISEHAESALHPWAEGHLARLAGHRVGLGEERRRQMEGERAALEA